MRKLSQRAYEIVKTLKNATYKEVAMKLVQELNEEDCEGEVSLFGYRTNSSRISREGSMMP